jgi:phage shock protein PspC (stress-responsive transcriptional regulator)
MHKKLPTVFAGFGLIVAGGLALLGNLGYADHVPAAVWAAVFAGLSLFSVVAYALSGVAQWGWLFPAGICGGVAVTLGLGTAGVRGAAVAAPVFAGLSVPFVAAYLLDRTQRWWALIPAGVMAALTVLMLIVDHLSGEWVGAGTLFLMAGAFLVVYVTRPERKWAALVAYILAVVGCMPLVASTGWAPLAGAVMLAAIALPFLCAYLVSPARWWAIIPAGVLLTTSALAGLAIVSEGHLDPAFANGLVLAGCSATFALVAVRHERRWAGVVAALLALLAVGAFLFRPVLEFYGPVLLVAAGLYLLYRALRTRTA